MSFEVLELGSARARPTSQREANSTRFLAALIKCTFVASKVSVAIISNYKFMKSENVVTFFLLMLKHT